MFVLYVSCTTMVQLVSESSSNEVGSIELQSVRLRPLPYGFHLGWDAIIIYITLRNKKIQKNFKRLTKEESRARMALPSRRN
jgi:hypothetical protein